MRRTAALLLLLASTGGCLRRASSNPNVIVLAVQSSPNNLDPRYATDDASQKIGQLIYDSLLGLDDHLQTVPRLAESFEHPDDLTYVARLHQGVRFHDGHELTAADVVYTFGGMINPDSPYPLRGGYRELASVTARDRYTVVFTLKQPFVSFPVNLVPLPILPDGAGPELHDHPDGTGPYRFVKYDVDDRIELSAFDGYWQGPPKNDGLVIKIVPDDIMRGLELQKATVDLVVNDLGPDIAYPLFGDSRLRHVETPGVDYQYVGVNTADPILKDARVRQALAYAIDRRSIIDYLRRGLATPAAGMLPPLSWAFAADEQTYPYDPARARQLLDDAGYPMPSGDGPRGRFHLTLKIANTQEFQTLQAATIQQNFRAVGVELDVRTYEFATLFNDVREGNFQLYTLQWTAGSMADPDILRRVCHSKQAPPIGFNR
ncbi:MAG TPA: ABC transporter substrate-binding protein, partial [Vicinamibacterales bacterium]|nr:ABC transporter substrate-binding protein [Vicinamibacterales bacterium]